MVPSRVLGETIFLENNNYEQRSELWNSGNSVSASKASSPTADTEGAFGRPEGTVCMAHPISFQSLPLVYLLFSTFSLPC